MNGKGFWSISLHGVTDQRCIVQLMVFNKALNVHCQFHIVMLRVMAGIPMVPKILAFSQPSRIPSFEVKRYTYQAEDLPR
jgi:hypothetical protein